MTRDVHGVPAPGGLVTLTGPRLLVQVDQLRGTRSTPQAVRAEPQSGRSRARCAWATPPWQLSGVHE